MNTNQLDYSTVPRRHIAFNGAQTKWWQHLTVCLFFFVLHSLLEVKVTEHERDADTRGGDGFGLWQSVRNVLKREHWLLKITLRVRKQTTRSHKHTHARRARTVTMCLGWTWQWLWLIVLTFPPGWMWPFLWFGMSQPTKQPARAKILPPRVGGGGVMLRTWLCL